MKIEPITQASRSQRFRKVTPWLMPEITLLKKSYPDEGPIATANKLPGRTPGAVKLKANKLGLKAPKNLSAKPGTPIHSTPEIDGMIRLAHRTAEPGWQGRLSEQIGHSAAWISKQCARLGLQSKFVRAPAWSKEELSLLEEHAHLKPATIARKLRTAGFIRSEGAIVRQISFQGYDRHDPDTWTLKELSNLMGVSTHVTTKWVDTYGLHHTRGNGTTRPHHHITRTELRRWIKLNSDLIDLRKVDQVWFKDVMWGAA